MKNLHCRSCDKPLNHKFADLGFSPLSNEYLNKESILHGQTFYPLVVNVCDNCFLVQTEVIEKPENIFSDYKYFSSFSSSWLKHCKEYVDYIVEYLKLNADSTVTEIACNDGYLLQYFKPYNIKTYGIEPSSNVAENARQKGIDVVVDFFNDKLVSKLEESYGKSDLIIGNNVFAHVPEINSFVKGIKMLLKDNGIVTLEFPHLLQLINLYQFDTIYHEHFSYLSISFVKYIFEKHGLKLFRIDKLPTHGGSVRIYATHSDNPVEISTSVNNILSEETQNGLNDISTYEKFDSAVKNIKYNSLEYLIKIKKSGKRIVAYGAAAKGNTFLNYCGIGKEFIDFVVDSNIHKQGLYLPGSQIPIVHIDELSLKKPDYVIILPWNLREEIAKQANFIRDWGGKFITFIPNIEEF